MNFRFHCGTEGCLGHLKPSDKCLNHLKFDLPKVDFPDLKNIKVNLPPKVDLPDLRNIKLDLQPKVDPPPDLKNIKVDPVALNIPALNNIKVDPIKPF